MSSEVDHGVSDGKNKDVPDSEAAPTRRTTSDSSDSSVVRFQSEGSLDGEEHVPSCSSMSGSLVASRSGSMTLSDLRAAGDVTSDRHDAFLARRAERKLARQRKAAASSTLDTHGFLSRVPEVQADIAYRFCFAVIGLVAKEVVEATCSNETMNDEALPEQGHRPEEAYRCFSRVPYPYGAERDFAGRVDPMKFSSDVPKLCKLIFNPWQSKNDIPRYRTRMEALSSALICTLVIDPEESEPSFHEQLLEYERVVDEMLFVKNALRPARGILLCRRNGNADDPVPPPPKGHLSWSARLEDHEQCLDEKLRKFGPVNLKDGHELHSAFATIASARVMRGQGSQGEDSDGSQQSEPPPCYGAEMDENHLPDIADDEEPVWLSHLHEVTDSEDESGAAPEETVPRSLSPTRYSGSRSQWMSAMQRGAA